MKLVTTRSELSKIQETELKNNTVGHVPTMGNLHQGHLELVKRSLHRTQKTLVTIFVNPKQFGPNEDFEKYPRTLEADLLKLKELDGADNIVVFAPQSTLEIYPEGFNTTIEVQGLDNLLCGANRPGHFKGVTTVVYQLFKLSGADMAFFGQKDFQQFKIIEKMVHDLSLEIELEMCPIIREPSGLALSSRNQYLSSIEREEARLIKETLDHLKELFLENREKALKKREDILFHEPRWQYLEILDGSHLTEVSAKTNQVVVAGAFLMGDTRLIDNILFDL
ncbi:MAG: pantoate--beta-alanine ligase [Bdellovibrionota bacterium]|nr:pantoate--beta-alanine ligase [Bdellovibrionota bacterium]